MWHSYAYVSTGTWQGRVFHYEEGKGTRHQQWQDWRDSNSQIIVDKFDHWWDKFSHKPQAIIEHILDNMESDVTHVVWLDCDVVQLEEYDDEWLHSRLPHDNDVFTYLDRKKLGSSENGWIAFNVKHPYIKTFMNAWQEMYFSNNVFKLDMWHDIGTFNAVYRMMKEETTYTGKTLRTKYASQKWMVSEAFQRSTLQGKFAHLKGPRKVYIKELVEKKCTLKYAMHRVLKNPPIEDFPWTEKYEAK